MRLKTNSETLVNINNRKWLTNLARNNMSNKYSIVIKDISLVKGQESPYNQYDLGNRYYRGQGTTQDFDKSVCLF